MAIPHSVLYSDTLLRQGGLMRCCLETIARYVAEHADETVTDDIVIDCMFEAIGNQKIRLEGGVWRWNKP